MIWHDVEQNGDEWDALRLGKATASNYGIIMANDGKAFGDPAKRYALQLALEQIKGCKSEFSFSNEHMERGHEQEPIARMLYEEMNFVDVDNGGFFDHETYGDSPDGLVGNDGVIEIKSVIAATHFSTLTRGSFDPTYRWQLIGHLDCSGRDWVDFISYCSDFPDGKQLIVYRLNAEECASEIERLRSRRADFIKLVAETKNRIMEVP
ncbi:YqaJ viral recombinase family protein [Escherichia coli]|nr:YqaJ viral recombinase family protein [Escherichia coli]EHM0713743.1 YqaJ viral recombinase family protein [Escherichia coli]EJS6324285.1 YqaJ viral recombinase family protein [Escherichia coli]EKM0761560.1 YqaJ viral recombinase family protein [Escherichia coli]EKQ6353150.1 YqaJ viral recombinase family protein [Escherichia coli]